MEGAARLAVDYRDSESRYSGHLMLTSSTCLISCCYKYKEETTPSTVTGIDSSIPSQVIYHIKIKPKEESPRDNLSTYVPAFEITKLNTSPLDSVSFA